eukprot:CAMPEP_0171109054 /NCGR_PEP_ID=MMETSP0766_2-20121228/70179_1 /TAXON_ID=439317 /ORGANISM="Gambierdiscus australes, Strain CAWD 149" /LENGTH=167 /DNA_ID=CAMNT_0011570713 /DNA_START=390 /DNA_END=890 /DNA_ORIENTATION=-
MGTGDTEPQEFVSSEECAAFGESAVGDAHGDICGSCGVYSFTEVGEAAKCTRVTRLPGTIGAAEKQGEDLHEAGEGAAATIMFGTASEQLARLVTPPLASASLGGAKLTERVVLEWMGNNGAKNFFTSDPRLSLEGCSSSRRLAIGSVGGGIASTPFTAVVQKPNSL